jgi:hypothetical protein
MQIAHVLLPVLCLLFALLVPRPAAAQVINEFVSANNTSAVDQDYAASDWIELFNPTGATINLGGYGLSDNLAQPFKWVFPEVSLAPGTYLVVWASGKNRAIPGAELHTNFSISSEGEPLLLTRPNGVRADELAPVWLSDDISYGRYPDGAATWRYFEQPTPGRSNNTTPYPGLVRPPVFSRAGSTYVDAFNVELTAESGAEIRYTLDGTAPNRQTSWIYTGPISMSQTRILRAKAFRTGYLSAPSHSEIYTRIGSVTRSFSSNLPIIILQQHQTPITSGDRTPASAVFIEPSADGRAYLNGAPEHVFSARIEADIRGSSSQNFPKKMYGFHLLEEDDSGRNAALLGLPADNNWILYAPYTDKTLLRNVFAYGLSASMGRYAPRTRLVELYLHSGTSALNSNQYHGVYVLVERIKWGEHRVHVTKLEPHDNSGEALTGGYIIKKDRLNAGESGFQTSRGTKLVLHRPAEVDATPAQKQYIRQYVNDFESALYGANYRDPALGYDAWIDTDSFIDHFLITELLKEIDGYRLSHFMHKERNGKLTMGPVWDFNLSSGNANYLNGWEPTGWYYTQLSPTNHCVIGCNIRNWYVRLLTDPAYVARMQRRWWELRNGPFSDAALTERLAGLHAEVNEAQERNYVRWPVLGTYVWPNWFIGQTYASEVDWMQNWLTRRTAWIDTQMGTPQTETGYRQGHFWLFGTFVPNDRPLQRLDPVWPDTTRAFLEFRSAQEGYPLTSAHPNWRKSSMERRNAPTSVNFRSAAVNQPSPEAAGMRGLQIRQPFVTPFGRNELWFHFPDGNTAGHQFSFAVRDEGAVSRIRVEYAANAGDPQWKTAGLSQFVFALQPDWQRIQVNLAHLTELDYNPHLRLRILFEGDFLADDNDSRVVFNNFSMDFLASVTSVDPAGGPDLPAEVALRQNWPNPFNPVTQIQYELVADARVRLVVYDMLGQVVSVLEDGPRPAGTHVLHFNAATLASGVYMYRLQIDDAVTISRRMTLIK